MLQIALPGSLILLKQLSDKVFPSTWIVSSNKLHLNRFLTPLSIVFNSGLFRASLAMSLCMLEIKNN